MIEKHLFQKYSATILHGNILQYLTFWIWYGTMVTRKNEFSSNLNIEKNLIADLLNFYRVKKCCRQFSMYRLLKLHSLSSCKICWLYIFCNIYRGLEEGLFKDRFIYYCNQINCCLITAPREIPPKTNKYQSFCKRRTP